MIYLGIDPGKSGAIAALSESSNSVAFRDIPVIKPKKGKSQYDVPGMVEAIAELLGITVGIPIAGGAVAILEKQQAMPPTMRGRTQGVSSSFQVGVGYGLWLGILASLRIPHKLVAPVSWKKAILADMPRDKEISLIVAKQLFPHAAGDLKLKKHEARAEALLIAEYGRRCNTISV